MNLSYIVTQKAMKTLLFIPLLFCCSLLFAQSFTIDQLECDTFFSTIFTDFIPANAAECRPKPRKTFRFFDRPESFDYSVFVDVQRAPDSVALHFAKLAYEPTAQFLGFVDVSQDTFRYTFETNRNGEDLEHYFFIPADEPSLLRVVIDYRISIVSGDILQTAFKTQFFKECEVADEISSLLNGAVCPERLNPCEPLWTDEVPPFRPLPNFSELWIDDCPDFFRPLWIETIRYNGDECSVIEKGFYTRKPEADLDFSFALDSALVHHFFTDNRNPSELKHKRSTVAVGTFEYTISTFSDKKRTHYFYVVDSLPSLIVLTSTDRIGDKIRYRFARYLSCDVVERQQNQIRGLTGYCPTDRNVCHPFDSLGRDDEPNLPDADVISMLNRKRTGERVFFVKDRTCGTGVGETSVTITIPTKFLKSCQEYGHVLNSDDGNFRHNWTMETKKFIAFGFSGTPKQLTIENLLTAKLTVQL